MTLYGYARASVREPEDKNLGMQVERLVRAGCAMGNIRAEEASGAKDDRVGLLDLVVPGIDGIDLMVEIAGVPDVPVIFLSAYGREENVIRALDMGAGDYIVKPFSPMELAARIRAELRKRRVPETPDPFVLGDLAVYFADRRVTLSGEPVPLTYIQYRLVAELAAHVGRVLTYEHLLQQVWGAAGDGDVRPIRTALSKIRRRLGDDPDNPTYIFTEPRVGYRMAGGRDGRPAPRTIRSCRTIGVRAAYRFGVRFSPRTAFITEIHGHEGSY